MPSITFTTKITYNSTEDILSAARKGPRTHLSFEFLDGLAHGLSVETIIDTYHVVLAELSIEPVVREAMLPLWLHGYLLGDPKYTDAALMPLSAGRISWRWPLFQHWLKKARDEGLWPEGWNHFREEGRDRRRSLRVQQVELLPVWLMSKIANRRDAARKVPNDIFDRWGWHLSTFGDDNEKLTEGCASGVSLDDWRTYPPFFPGDHTRISLNKPPRQRASEE